MTATTEIAEQPLKPGCTACPFVRTYPGGGRSISFCEECNAYSNAEFERRSQSHAERLATVPPPQTRADVLEWMDAALGEYPQYEDYGRTPEWVMIEVERRVMGGAGLAFEPGDRTLAYRDDGEYSSLRGSWFGYSWRNKVATIIDFGAFRLLEPLTVPSHTGAPGDARALPAAVPFPEPARVKSAEEVRGDRLRATFRLVADPEDWKAPINEYVPQGVDQAELAEAIMYMTATEAYFETESDGRVKVRAMGYRMGPAGG